MKRFVIFLAAVTLAACASDQTKRPHEASASLTKDEPSPVGVIPTALLHDTQRNKDLDISIEYPTRAGTYPVIIFSHGYGATNRDYEPLVDFWTGRGFVVIRPAHADAGALREAMRAMAPPQRGNDERGDRRRRGQQAQPLQPAPFRANPAEAFWEKEREPQWRDRARDITQIIDSLGALEERFPELKGKMDRVKIGVGGQGYGAFIALLVAGAKTSGNAPLQVGDARVTAVIAMSPEGIAANRELSAESFRDIKVPVMFMTGSRDFGAVETETPEWRKTAYENSPAGDKYFVLIEGARYSTFSGMAPALADTIEAPMIQQPIVDPRTGQVLAPAPGQPRSSGAYFSDRGLFERVRSISLSFWNAYLKNDAKAKESLTPTTQPAGNVTVEKK